MLAGENGADQIGLVERLLGGKPTALRTWLRYAAPLLAIAVMLAAAREALAVGYLETLALVLLAAVVLEVLLTMLGSVRPADGAGRAGTGLRNFLRISCSVVVIAGLVALLPTGLIGLAGGKLESWPRLLAMLGAPAAAQVPAAATNAAPAASGALSPATAIGGAARVLPECVLEQRREAADLRERHVFGGEYIVGNKEIKFATSVGDGLTTRSGKRLLARDITGFQVIRFRLDPSDMSPQSNAVFDYVAGMPVASGTVIRAVGDVQVKTGGVRNENWVRSNRTGTTGAELVGIFELEVSFTERVCS